MTDVRLYLLILAACFMSVCIFYVDATVLQNGLSEISMTELTQSGAVLCALLLCLFVWRGQKPTQTFFTLFAIGLVIILIREQDAYLNAIYHGSWALFALFPFLLGLYFLIRRWTDFWLGFRQLVGLQGFPIVILGLLIVAMFSRVFGTTDVWVTLLESRTEAITAKTAVQEGIELFGYLVMLAGLIDVKAQLMRPFRPLVRRGERKE